MSSWEEFSRLLEAKKLDPVGKEDKDIDNDGDHDESDKYLLNRRRVRSKIIAPKEKLKTDRDMFNIPKSEKDAARERLLAKAKAKREKVKEEVEQLDEAIPLAVGAGIAGAGLVGAALLRAKQAASKKNRNDAAIGKPTIQGAASAIRKRNEMLRQVQNQSFQPEGESIEEKADTKEYEKVAKERAPKDDEKFAYGFKDNKKRVKDLKKLKRLVKHYDALKKGDPMVDSYEPEGDQLSERPYQVYGYDEEGKKERKVGKPVKSKKYAADRAAELEDTHKKKGGRYRYQYVEEVENIEEKSVSRAQQRFFGMVRAAQKGEMDSPSAEVSKAASSMSKSDVKDFAKTKHDKLPEKKETKEELSLVDKILEEVLNEAPKHTISGGKSKAKKYKAVAKQAKLAAAVNKMMKDDSEQESAPEPKKTEKERKTKAKKESKEKGKTATEKAARTTAAGRIRAAKIKRQTEREKEAARTERQKERDERTDRLRKERKSEKEKAKAERDKEKQKELEAKSKEKIRSAEESEAKKKVAAQQKRKEEAQGEARSALSKGTGSLEKSSQDDKLSASFAKSVGNVGSLTLTGARLAKAGAKYGVAALKKRKEAKKQEELKKKNDEERAKEKEPVKESLSNWREEFIFEVEGEDKKEKIIDITKKKNKIEINPNMGESAAWTKKEGKSEAGGLNEKGRKSYERENPGSDLKRPSKKVGNPRRKSFCSRMLGMKKKLTSKKTANDPDSRINKSLRAWNC